LHSRIDGVGIKCISVAVPSNKIAVKEIVSYKSEDEIKRAIRSTGISSLRLADQGVTTSDLCESAAVNIFTSSNHKREDICAIVFVTQTPDYFLPGTSCLLQSKLGFNEEVLCYDVNGGCCGYVYGLQLASMLSRLHGKDVLLLAGETNSKLICREDFSTAIMLADAGSATIVGEVNKETYMDFSIRNYGSKFDKLIIPAGAFRNPPDSLNEAVTERENGNKRSDRNTYMDGLAIMNFALTDVAELVKDTISREQDIDLFVFHQANKMIVNSVAAALKLPLDKVPIFVDGYGNTSSASIPLALCGTANDKPEGMTKYKKVLLAGFGVGLSCGTVVTDLKQTIFLPIKEV